MFLTKIDGISARHETAELITVDGPFGHAQWIKGESRIYFGGYNEYGEFDAITDSVKIDNWHAVEFTGETAIKAILTRV